MYLKIEVLRCTPFDATRIPPSFWGLEPAFIEGIPTANEHANAESSKGWLDKLLNMFNQAESESGGGTSHKPKTRITFISHAHATAKDMARHEAVFEQAARQANGDFVLLVDFGGPSWFSASQMPLPSATCRLMSRLTWFAITPRPCRRYGPISDTAFRSRSKKLPKRSGAF